jgi:ribonuclease P protein 1
MKMLQKHMPVLHEPWFPVDISYQCFSQLSPKEQSVYLTPHCRNDLEKWDHDAIYIIRAMEDKSNNEPLSLAKAMRLGLKMKRLPLDNHLK